MREFCEKAFGHAGLDYEKYVTVDERYFRPAEVNLLIGDSSKAQKCLGWKSNYSFSQLVVEMVDADIEHLQNSMRS